MSPVVNHILPTWITVFAALALDPTLIMGHLGLCSIVVHAMMSVHRQPVKRNKKLI